MGSKWFRLPEAGDGTDENPFRPDSQGFDIDGWSGQKSHPDGGPKWVVRVYAEQTTLDDLASDPNVQQYDRLPSQALNNMLGQDRTADGWRRGFAVGDS